MRIGLKGNQVVRREKGKGKGNEKREKKEMSSKYYKWCLISAFSMT